MKGWLCALVGVLALAGQVRADELRGPTAVFAGEDAIFYWKAGGDAPLLRSVGRNGSNATFQGSNRFAAGEYTVRGSSVARRLVVNALPPPVSPDAPLEKRLAVVQLAVWDGDQSTKGRTLEELGRRLAPRSVSGSYAVVWNLSGRQATRRNVDYALEELAKRGYVVDVFAAVHGYPILLADGPWLNVRDSKGLRAVRLFYTTACFGAQGADEFQRAGVKAFVGAKTENYVHSVHAYYFVKAWRAGASVEEANARATASVDRLLHVPLLGWALRKTLLPVGPDGSKRNLGSRPVAFGAVKTTLATDPQAKALAKKTTARANDALARSRGLVGAIGE